MQHTSRTSILNPDIVSAWQEQLAVAVKTPGLLAEILRRRDELLPRFTAYYIQLRALPRRVRRALQRQWHLPLAGVALMLALGQSPALAATIPVGGSCTLVGAITAANTDTATGGCVAGSGADTIVLPLGSTQTLTSVNNSTYGPTGLPVISSVLTIVGQGSTITRASGAPEFRLLAVSSTGDLTLQDTTVSGGKVVGRGGCVANSGTFTMTNSTISGNSASSNGGGVFNGSVVGVGGGTLTVTNSTISGNSGGFYGGGGVANFYNSTLTITNSTISGNTANFGGGVSNVSSILTITNSTISGNSGGGVDNGTFGGALTVTNVTNSTISGNVGYSGGGVANGGTLTVTNSTISGNSASSNGGGVANGGTLTLTNSTISGNTAFGESVSGGGVFNGGTLTITNSTISGNSGSFTGGGVANSGTLTVTNSTISGNTSHEGGGMFNQVFDGGALTVTNSTISGNTAFSVGGGVSNFTGALILARTLVSGNTAYTAPEISNYVTYSGGTVVADNHNLFGVNGTAGVDGFSPGATDLVPPAGVQLPGILNPVLAFNGGPTETHALVPGSPAIDAGGPVCLDPNGNPLLTDQRGKPRIVDGNGDGTSRCDIGAFEFFPVVNNFVTLAPGLDTAFDSTPVPGGPAGTFTIGAIFTNTSSTPLRFPFFTVTELSAGNLLLNADEGTQGVGATVTPNVGDQVLSPGETVAVDFVIGLQAPRPFTFFVDLFGEPLVSGSSTVRQRPNVSTKGVRR